MSAQPAQPSASRRSVLRGAALAGAAGVGLTACGGAEGRGVNASATPTAPVDLGPAAEVPVGGARLYREQRLLVSRPAEGEYRAFSAVCTHQRCVLDKIEGTEANCPCHRSRFDATSGKVLQGPAVAALPPIPVTVRDGNLIAGPQT
ncbi:Rieske (2Fe-2S) protein [Streptomyces sp. URMC 123]|uniref:Rieske (2Fe-2S) protein n=1 Tax=Streptomyces sp. URMC 123 TaxID=3423403 RepID=UPI003F1BCB1F